ncbi:MAG: RNA polymerase factor sigma-54 [Planctomycetota bacterium]|nr:RNA polymerase factor sigma-54 [Planctomycetota bacterium]
MDRPSLSQGLRQRGEQQLALAPRMLQSIEVLRIPACDLESYLEQVAADNGALVLGPPQEASPAAGQHSSFAPGTRGAGREATERHDEMLRNHPAGPASLSEQVALQLADLGDDDELTPWLHFLLGCLDEAGYLSVSDERLLELAAESGLTPDAGLLGLAIARLQTLEPRGLGARNAIEALLLQLEPSDPDYADLCRLLEDFLEELAQNKLPAVARAMELDMPGLQTLLTRLGGLEMRPVAALAESGAEAIRPDVLVDWTGSGFEVRVDRSAFPAVSVDEEIKALARRPDQEREARDWFRQRLDQARWIVEAVEQRGRTLLRVSRALFHYQRAFLEEGPGHLLPLRMHKLAQDLGIHVSTVSRTVSGKHVQTPWGIFPLRHFFQAAGGTEEPGGAVAARGDVRDEVRRVVEAEDGSAPLSDDAIAAALSERGRPLARRTVAKYRRELGIPSSYRRRRFD